MWRLGTLILAVLDENRLNFVANHRKQRGGSARQFTAYNQGKVVRNVVLGVVRFNFANTCEAREGMD